MLGLLTGSIRGVFPFFQSNPQQLPPEVRYASQLQTLASMGFTNQSANLQGRSILLVTHTSGITTCKSCVFVSLSALIFSHGDVNAAIDRLLGQGN